MSNDSIEATSISIKDVGVRQFAAPPPATTQYPAAMGSFSSSEPVRGWLVGVSDGTRWGWWGPLPKSIAGWVGTLFRAVDEVPACATPQEWSRVLRRATRHAHTGELGAAVGAFELASWDLLGIRADCPVWALSDTTASPTPIETYATSFGVDPMCEDAVGVAESVASIWKIQKWHPGTSGLTVDAVDRLASVAGGDERMAVDFHGQWAPEDVADLSRRAEFRLAWVEEPYSPHDLFRAVPGEFGTRHAAGEHCYGPSDAAALRAAGVDVWQPDAVFCGGYDDLRSLLAIAAASRALSAPHGGGFLPALHAAVEGAPMWLIEYHLLLEPRRQAHLSTPTSPCFSEGSSRLAPPTMPGWGGHLHAAIRGGHHS